MEKLCLSSTISSPFLSPIYPTSRARKRVHFPLNRFSVFASKEDPTNITNNSNANDKLNQWDLMELKFGKMLGEDPKLTMAKIMGKKVNPDASYLEIEKDFYRNKGKLVEVKELPFDVPEKLGSRKVANGLNLVKPVPKKGIVVGGGEENPKLPEIKRPSGAVRSRSSGAKSSVPNVILRKPSVYNEKDDEVDSSSRLRIKPNLSLSMRTEPVMEKFSGMTLLKKPQPSTVEEDHGGESDSGFINKSMYSGLTNKPANGIEGDMENEGQSMMIGAGEVNLLDKPNAIVSENNEGDGASFESKRSAGMMLEDQAEGSSESAIDLEYEQDQSEDQLQTEMQHLEQTDAGNSEKEIGTMKPLTVRATASEFSVDSILIGKPKRLDQPRKATSYPIGEGAASAIPQSLDGEGVRQSLEETEETAWTRVEQRFKFGDRVDVELISCSPRGFVVSYGSLIGFLPYRNLAAKWKFLAFESWLRRNGLDPSKYRQNLGIIGSDEGPNLSTSLESLSFTRVGEKAEIEVTADMELEDLLRIYDQDKILYLSSYVGQRIKVNILLADRKSRKLIFSMRPKEKEEIVEKKRSLMAKLSVGDVVKCCIKKITYFGIFVEVEEVPALIHQTEVSWVGTLDPASYLKIGQTVEAKVHQLDFALERIFLSLKEITPDPLNEALECIVGNNSFTDGLEAAQADTEWPDVDLLVKELQKIDGVQSVTKGRFFLSPGLAPTFQVYMASMFENQYKLLARSGNKVQEVMVQSSLDKEEMKSTILKCTNRVEL